MQPTALPTSNAVTFGIHYRCSMHVFFNIIMAFSVFLLFICLCLIL